MIAMLELHFFDEKRRGFLLDAFFFDNLQIKRKNLLFPSILNFCTANRLVINKDILKRDTDISR